MIKIIKEGNIPKATIECPNCHSLLEYGNADLYRRITDNMNICSHLHQYYFTCPVCGCEVIAHWIYQS